MEPQYDLICFSHLRWHFVFQRPQHLLSRCAAERRVYYVEEPVFEGSQARLDVAETSQKVIVLTPFFPDGTSQGDVTEQRKKMLREFFAAQKIDRYVAWFYTPMAIDWYDTSDALAVVYDCMDELSLFKGASSRLVENEKLLFKKADLVFTGGVSLYEYKKQMHPSVYAFPSSVDFKHFAQARTLSAEPAEQAMLPRPRLGFFGVIDERMNLELIDELAHLRPDFQIILIGPVVKIDPASLPQCTNIHYFGSKKYEELPQYLSGWDVALMPFALNDSTRFISPTKTPEYLAAGIPVVSTSIKDVVSPYGINAYVRIADTAPAFAEACQQALEESRDQRLKRVDAFLATMSWDTTWRSMSELVCSVMKENAVLKNFSLQQVGEGESHV